MRLLRDRATRTEYEITLETLNKRFADLEADAFWEQNGIGIRQISEAARALPLRCRSILVQLT